MISFLAGVNIFHESYPRIGVRESKVDQRSSIPERCLKKARIVLKSSLRDFSMTVMTVMNIAKSASVLFGFSTRECATYRYIPARKKRNAILGKSSKMRNHIFTGYQYIFA